MVQVKKTGICGSDVHFLVEGRIGDFVVEKPMVLGHESAGIVCKVGSNVKHLQVGDRVAIEPGATCRKCELCKAGRYELCPDIVFAATPPHDGTLGRYYLIPADLAYPLPENASLEDGAMIEPLAVGVHSVANLGGLRANQAIAVFGCGPVGLLCMAVAKALGASRIIGIDINPSRLEFAKQYAATHTYLPLKPEKGEVEYGRRNAADMKKQLGITERGSGGIDLVIDASGAEASIQTAIYIVKAGGTVVQVGMGNPNVTMNVVPIIAKEIIYKGSFRYGPGDYPLAISLVANGKIDLKPLVTHRFNFDEAVIAFEATRAGKSNDGKGVIKAIISGPA
jgi:D-xylulose reductase